MSAGGFLDRSRTVATPGFDRWLVPPCALAIHLCIGMAYGFSVFWLPLSGALGHSCPGLTLAGALTTTICDWRVSDLVWTYSIFFVVLGAAAALWGGWLERAGPRKAGVVAACCWCGGMAIGAVGVSLHELWLLWLGTGLVGGIGLGLGYISPVSTLIKWFPDRRGLATGMAIMGFGGGAMIGGPLADRLIRHFAGPGGPGVWQAMLTLAAIYLVFMLAGALGYRVPPEAAGPADRGGGARGVQVHLRDAHRTPQFWLIWLVLLLNVSASIGIIGVASPMLQELFGGSLAGAPGTPFIDLDPVQKAAVAATGAGFVGLISLFNIGGRFAWASLSDRLGRKWLFAIILLLGALLYGLVLPAVAGKSVGLFILGFCLCASMYGGGFATVPAYLADTFGTRFVGAIHGRLLTAWSTAGVVGPMIVTSLRERRLAAGVPRDQLYGPIFWTLAGLLAVGFLANLAIRPVADRFHMAPALEAEADATAFSRPAMSATRITPVLLLAWAAAGLPIAWGVYQTLAKAAVLLK